MDLKPEHLRAIRTILKNHAPHAIVWAFGSRVTGQSHSGSDLDLVLQNKDNPQQQQPNLSQIRSAFSESDLPFSIDILDWANIPNEFKEKIKQHYEIINT